MTQIPLAAAFLRRESPHYEYFGHERVYDYCALAGC
jgi:hypothetical protein